MTDRTIGNILIVANFPSETGYAWNTIGEYFHSLGTMFIEQGRRAVLCYPKVNGTHELFRGSGIEIVEFDFFGSRLSSIFRFIQMHDIQILYLTDRPVYSFKYIASRLAGVKKIIIHDRTSGHRDVPGRIKRWLKTAIHKRPFFSVDLAIGVSDYVKNRLINVSCLPASRVLRVHNALDIAKFKPDPDDLLYRKFGISTEYKIVFSHSRANTYKGIQTLIEAADILVNQKNIKKVVFVYCGDGPDLEFFRGLVKKKNLIDSFLCPGNCDQIHRLLRGAAMVVVPSIWQEALGLSVIEGMASGKPVVAARVGGIVEIITDKQNGFLFNPQDSSELAEILATLLKDPALGERIGTAARESTVEHWNIRDRKIELNEVFRQRVLNDRSRFPDNPIARN